MKKLLLFVTLLFSVSIANAQLRKVPAAVTEAFKTKFPEAKNVEWKDKVTGFEAGFRLNGDKMYSKFNKDGEWEKTETVINFESLDEEVQNGFEKSKYKDWEIKDVRKIESEEHGLLYKIEVKKNAVQKKNLFFNEAGELQKDNITI